MPSFRAEAISSSCCSRCRLRRGSMLLLSEELLLESFFPFFSKDFRALSLLFSFLLPDLFFLPLWAFWRCFRSSGPFHPSPPSPPAAPPAAAADIASHRGCNLVCLLQPGTKAADSNVTECQVQWQASPCSSTPINPSIARESPCSGPSIMPGRALAQGPPLHIIAKLKGSGLEIWGLGLGLGKVERFRARDFWLRVGFRENGKRVLRALPRAWEPLLRALPG